MKRGILAIVSDIHAGNRYGLMNPDTIVRDAHDNKRKISEINGYGHWNKYLWNDVYQWGIANLKKIAKKDDIYLIVNGDVCDGDKYMEDKIGTRLSDQVIIASDDIDEILKINNVVGARIASGTSSHSFGEGSAEELVCNILSAKHSKKDIAVVDHGLIDFFGVKTDFAHHGPAPGSKEWTSGSGARSYALDIQMQEIFHHETPPDLILRSHFHKYVREVSVVQAGEDEYETMIIVTPSMCLLGGHGRQATRSISRVVNGMIAVEIIDGKIYRVHRLIKTLDIRKREKYG